MVGLAGGGHGGIEHRAKTFMSWMEKAWNDLAWTGRKVLLWAVRCLLLAATGFVIFLKAKVA